MATSLLKYVQETRFIENICLFYLTSQNVYFFITYNENENHARANTYVEL